MSSNPRRESLSLFDILNPPSETYAPVPHLPASLGATRQQQQIEQAEPEPTAADPKAEYVPSMDAPSLIPMIQVKTEASRDSEFNEDDQELLAAAEVSSS